MNDTESQPVSLFPMFNILICTLGVLVFILTAIVTIALGVGKLIVVVPEATVERAQTKTPVFMEWNGRTLTVTQTRDSISFDTDVNDIPTYRETYEYIEQAIAGTALERILAQVKEHASDQYIFLLIRPSGFYNFNSIKAYVQAKGIDIGFEPIDENWTVTAEGPDAP